MEVWFEMIQVSLEWYMALLVNKDIIMNSGYRVLEHLTIFYGWL
jgi:hypothetical protein